jgi:kinetochore protein Spc7/SPC105
MAQTDSKENIADGLIANGSFKAPAQSPKKPALSPKKSSRKTRSKSIGPGGLGELEAPALKESSGNRRKVCKLYAMATMHLANQTVCFHPRRQVDFSLQR